MLKATPCPCAFNSEIECVGFVLPRLPVFGFLYFQHTKEAITSESSQSPSIVLLFLVHCQNHSWSSNFGALKL